MAVATIEKSTHVVEIRKAIIACEIIDPALFDIAVADDDLINPLPANLDMLNRLDARLRNRDATTAFGAHAYKSAQFVANLRHAAISTRGANGLHLGAGKDRALEARHEVVDVNHSRDLI